MAPSLRAYASAVGTGLSQSVTVPASTEGGDILVLFVMAGSTPTQPSGWTRIDNQTGTNMAGRVFTKRAAGAAGTTSTDAGASVVCAVATSAPTQVYLAVIRDAVGVWLRGSQRVSTLSLTASHTHPQASALLVTAAAVRVAAPSTLTINSPGTAVDQQSANSSIAGLLATIPGPTTAVAGLAISPVPSPTQGSYVGTVVAWDSPTDSVFDHQTDPPPAPSGTLSALSGSTKTVGGVFESSVASSVKAVWLYIASRLQVGQTVTAAVWASTAATSPLVTASIVVTNTGWLRIPLTSWPRVSAATPFVVSVSYSASYITFGSSPPHQFPFSYNRLTLTASRTSTLTTVPINPATNSTAADYFVSPEITTATEVEVVGGGGPTAGVSPLSASVFGGGSVTSRVPLLTSVSGGGGTETIAWQTEFPGEDVPDIDPAAFVDPDAFDEPPVLQSTLDMPDPSMIVDGVPVDWEPV